MCMCVQHASLFYYMLLKYSFLKSEHIFNASRTILFNVKLKKYKLLCALLCLIYKFHSV